MQKNRYLKHIVYYSNCVCILDIFLQQLPSVNVVTSSPNISSPNNQQSFTIETGSDPNNGVQVKISVSQSQNQSQHQNSNSALLTKYILELLMQRKKSSTTTESPLTTTPVTIPTTLASTTIPSNYP